MPITLIYTRTDKLLISKEDVDWKIWQDKLYWFMASLPFDNIVQCADYLKEDFNLDEQHRQYIIDFIIENDKKVFQLDINKKNIVKIIPLQIDLLQLEGEIIDWLEWTYFFAKKSNNYELWVYLGGIAEQVREIKLSEIQVKNWAEQGNSYILQLATDLQQRNSQTYLEAINENRKII